MIKFSSFVGTASPNGCSIFHLLLGSTTVNVKYKSTAIPMESNPRPILAVVAGTIIFIFMPPILDKF